MQFLVPLPVAVQGPAQLGQAGGAVFEDQLLDGGQGIGHVGHADTGQHRPDVVEGPALAQVEALLQAAVHQRGEEGPGRQLGVHVLGNQRSHDGVFNQVAELRVKRLPDLVNRLERGRIPRPQAPLQVVQAAPAIVQGKLQRRGQVDVGRRRPLAHFAKVGHHAAAVVPVAGVRRRQASGQQHGRPHAVVVHRRKTGAQADEAADLQQKFLGTIGVDAHAQAGLVGPHVGSGPQAHVGQLVGPITAIPLSSAHRQVLEGAVAGKVPGRIGRDGPYPFRELDPQALDELLGALRGEDALLHVPLVVGIHVLVKSPQVEGHSVFGDHPPHLHEPDHLRGLPKGPGRVGRHPAAVLRYLLQFLLSPGIRFPLGQRLRLPGITLAQADQRRAGDDRRLVKVDLFDRFAADRLQPGETQLGLLPDPGEPLGKDDVLVIGRDLAHVSPPLGIVVDDAGIHRQDGRLFRQPGQVGLLQRLAPPVRENLIGQYLPLLGRDPVGVLLPRLEAVHLFLDPLPGHLGVNARRAPFFARRAHQQLLIKDDGRDPLARLLERPGPPDDQRLTPRLPVRPGEGQRPLDAQRRLRPVIVVLDAPAPRGRLARLRRHHLFLCRHVRTSPIILLFV